MLWRRSPRRNCEAVSHTLPASQKAPPFRFFQIGKRSSWLRMATAWPPSESPAVDWGPRPFCSKPRTVVAEAVLDQEEGIHTRDGADPETLGPDEGTEGHVAEDLAVEADVAHVG